MFPFPSADPIDCEACGMILAPVSRVISAGGDPDKEYMALIWKGPPLRALNPHRRAKGDPSVTSVEDVYAVCQDCARDLETLEARIFAHRCRAEGHPLPAEEGP